MTQANDWKIDSVIPRDLNRTSEWFHYADEDSKSTRTPHDPNVIALKNPSAESIQLDPEATAQHR